MTAEELIKQGKPEEALAALQQRVRSEPADAKLRVFLFQLLCVLGQWERALTQLNVAVELDAINLLMAQVCKPAIECEVFRGEVFQGKRAPLILGEPESWIGSMVQALQHTANGDHAAASELRGQALEAAPAVGGTIDDETFTWLADADSRLGPILEAVCDGRYYWVPMHRLKKIALDKPVDLRDAVWLPCKLTLSTGVEKVALIPTRYAGTEQSKDGMVQLSRTTEWKQLGEDTFVGLGQRVLATDNGEYPIMQAKAIVFSGL